jgi:lipoprotein NlpI
MRHIQGDSTGALADLERAIKLDPENEEVFLTRARIRETQADLHGALQDLTEAIRLKPKLETPYIQRARYFAHKGDLKAALNDIEKYHELDSESGEAFYERACLHYDRQAWLEALRDLELCLKSKSHIRPYFHFRIALARLRLGEKGAQDALREALKREETDPWTGTIGKYILGELSDEELVKAAGRRMSRQCQAFYYVGTNKLIANDVKAARQWFERCLCTHYWSCREYESAQVELNRLK